MAAAAGFTLACLTAVGNAMTDVGRKRLGKTGIGSALQIAIVCLLEGLLGTVFLTMTGAFTVPAAEFWLPAVSSAILNAIAKTLQTKAYNEYDISLCAPFNAALPVMQFLVSTFILREPQLPLHRVAGVFVVAAGASWLAMRGAPPPAKGSSKAEKASYMGPLPTGAVIVLFNCMIWSFTTKLDELATRVAGGWTYLTYGKLMTGAWAYLGDKLTSAKGAAEKDKKDDKEAKAAGPIYLQPKVMAMLFGVACAEGIYMLCYYGAITRVSKVYVVAIKKGGGLLISAMFGVLFFGENIQGRLMPILAIVSGVVLLAV
jgi:uncharacterized membrane protein